MGEKDIYDSPHHRFQSLDMYLYGLIQPLQCLGDTLRGSEADVESVRVLLGEMVDKHWNRLAETFEAIEEQFGPIALCTTSEKPVARSREAAHE
ncbi:hypothetical protein [Desulfovibrio oxyclinae]|jgi:hypothetical protein|uniref:hypothetical protein n=1 Tax=Desulfovibrio oxyclinae TaxID=63560 RepID=UPI00036ABA37|nr:hypothetical protein [Desulfovibrio oxyclinae]